MAVSYTDEQRACIDSLVGPVDVSAGAGSGKTFTLTQRIAAALAAPDSGVDDIDQVCAITFTEKAAAELKGRVRSTLRAQGMFEQALKVDAAWISTIHGMCARILRASALDLGLDPAFKVVTGKLETDLMRESLGSAIEAAGGKNGRYAALFREYRTSSAFSETSVEKLVGSLMDEATNLRHGLDDFELCIGSARPREIARRLLEVYEGALPVFDAASPNKTNDAAREKAHAAVDALAPYVAGQGDDTVEDLAAVLGQCPKVSAGRSKDLKEVAAECASALEDAAAQALMLQGDAMLQLALGLAREAEATYAANKRKLGVLDTNDLIAGALDALEVPEILARFSDRFRLVMVDEFQDTDALQLAIVKKLCGPGMRYLCTVGDAQQSIYGFRGADVNLYRAYQGSLDDEDLRGQGGQPKKLQLSKNFRSHNDILAFVKKVCAQQSVFGDAFLDLSDDYDGRGYLAQSEPRIQLNCTMLVPDGRKGSIGDAVEVQAREIARYFARMHEAGHDLSEMVLLLGKVKNADVYAEAIRAEGFPCVVTGGSLFAQMPEVLYVRSVVAALANPRDTQSLFAALSGPAFNLSAGDLLRLGTRLDEESGRMVADRLYRGLAGARFAGESEEGAALSHAVRTMQKAQRSLKTAPSLHLVLLQVLEDSGWIGRLQQQGPEGMATLANVMKAVRFVRDIQDENDFGVAQTAKFFSQMLEEGMREAPGALNLSGQEAIRVLTIHASKGLEFPIVAMADFAFKPSGGDLVVQRVEGRTFVSLKGRIRALSDKRIGSAAFKADELEVEAGQVTAVMVETADAVRRRTLLEEVSKYEQLAESQRLFYVGATRAKEALCIFMCMKKGSKVESTYVSTFDDVRSAFCGPDGAFEPGMHELDYGGAAPAQLTVTEVDYAALAAEREAAAAQVELPHGQVGEMSLPRVRPAVQRSESVPERKATGLFSYSSIAHGGEDGVEGLGASSPFIEADGDQGDVDDLVTQVFAARESADADKATDFGSALHRLCQIAALTDADRARRRVDDMCTTYGVRDRDRLVAALERWLGSSVYEESLAYELRQPELAFTIPVGPGVLEGEIDLLCTHAPRRAGVPSAMPGAHEGACDELCGSPSTDGRAGAGAEGVAGADGGAGAEVDAVAGAAGGHALIVDYKTGGSAVETPAQLQEKHGLQARCYAYATLMQGYTSVDLAFVRVERDDPTGADSLEAVRYHFDRSDLEALREVITAQAVAAQ